MSIDKQVGEVGIDASANWAQQCLELMARHQVSPTPSNYCLWYHYVAGSLPALKREMQAMLESGAAFSLQENVRLFEKYFGTERETKGLERIGGDLTQAIGNVIKQIGQAGQESNAFVDRLRGFDGSLRNAANDSESVQEIVLGLIQATQDIASQNRELQSQLQGSSTQVSRLQQHLQQVRHEAMTDGLTGVANRRCFDLKLVEHSKAALESSTELCLVMIDIDHFKRFNDTYGHRVGDQVLRVLGAQLKAATAGDETPARYGGEEFALLPNCSLDLAAQRADQLRRALSEHYLRNKATGESFGQVTVSIGIARYRANEPLEDFLHRADTALYSAKNQGRNRVIAEAA